MLKKGMKRTVSAVLTLAMIVVSVFVGSTVVLAEDPAVDTTAIGLTSSSDLVKVYKDKIVVTGSNQDCSTKTYVTSETIITALVVSQGYTLSYLNSDKKAPATTVADVHDGWVRATDGTATIDIPVVDNGPVYAYPNTTYDNKDSQSVSFSTEKGIAGKSDDDASRVLEVGDTAVAAGKLPRFEFGISAATEAFPSSLQSFMNTDSNLNTSFTYEFNLYAPVDFGIPQITCRTNKVFRWNADGSIEYWKGSAYVNSGKTLARGKWYHMAVVYDYTSKKILLYVNGILFFNDADNASNTGKTGVRIGLSEGSKNCSLAVDDVTMHVGYYYPAYDQVAIKTPNVALKLDSNTNTLSYNTNIIGANDLMDAINTAFAPKYMSYVTATGEKTQDAASAAGIYLTSSASGRTCATYTLNGVAQSNQEFGKILDVNFNGYESNTKDITTNVSFNQAKTSYRADPQTGMYGKSSDDTAFVISKNVNETPASTSDNAPQINHQIAYTLSNYETITFECDFAMNSNVVPSYMRIVGDEANIYPIQFQANNVIRCGIGNLDVGQYKVNQWYKVAFEYKPSDTSYKVFLNGVQVNSGTKNLGAKINRFVCSTTYAIDTYDYANGTSTNAFDNYRIYSAPYESEQDVVSFAPNAAFTADAANNKLLLAADYTGKTVADLANTANYSVYTDNSCATALTSSDAITAGNVVVAKSDSGEVFDYYTLGTPSTGAISFTVADNKITALTYSNVSNPTDYDLYIVSYNAGEMQQVQYVNLQSGADTTAQIDYDAANTYKAFVWTRSNLKPIQYNLYVVE